MPDRDASWGPRRACKAGEGASVGYYFFTSRIVNMSSHWNWYSTTTRAPSRKSTDLFIIDIGHIDVTNLKFIYKHTRTIFNWYRIQFLRCCKGPHTKMTLQFIYSFQNYSRTILQLESIYTTWYSLFNAHYSTPRSGCQCLAYCLNIINVPTLSLL